MVWAPPNQKSWLRLCSWGPTKESLSLLYKAFVRPVLTYASPGWFPFLCSTATNHLQVLHRAACRVITGCLSCTPSFLLLLEAKLPPLKLTLEHQAFSSFERALRLPPDFSSFKQSATQTAEMSSISCRVKPKTIKTGIHRFWSERHYYAYKFTANC